MWVWVLLAFSKADRPAPVSPFPVLAPGHLQQCQLCGAVVGTELAGCLFWSFVCLLVFFWLACVLEVGIRCFPRLLATFSVEQGLSLTGQLALRISFLCPKRQDYRWATTCLAFPWLLRSKLCP